MSSSPGLRATRIVAGAVALETFRLAIGALIDEGFTERRIAIGLLGVSQQHLQDVRCGKRALQAWMYHALATAGRDVVSRELRQSIPREECSDCEPLSRAG